MISYDVTEHLRPMKRFERGAPKPQGTEVLLRTLATGMCHSDLHLWEGGFNLGAAGKLNASDLAVKLPLTMGHEIAGEVIALGPQAEDVVVGGKYLVYPWIGCGDCAVCRGGDEQYCTSPRWLGVYQPGGYSDHVLVPHYRYLIPLAGLAPEEAAPYACSGLTAFCALRKLHKSIHRGPILIIGAGGLGLMCLSLLKAMDGRGAIITETNARKREAALAAGALAAIDATDAEAAAKIRHAAGGQVFGVIDFVGDRSTLQLGLQLLGNGGKLVIVGLFGGDIDLPIPQIPLRGISIEGSLVGSLADLRELIALVKKAAPQPIPITCRPLSEVNLALEELRSGKVIGRNVIVP